jgi:hypothetical protein
MSDDKTISITINVDTREGFDQHLTTSEVMMQGARSKDFITYGVLNKRKFFDGLPVELTLFVDLHNDLDLNTLDTLGSMVEARDIDNLVLNRHTRRFQGQSDYSKCNDINFLHAMMMGRGKYIVHFDGDMAAFRAPGDGCIEEWLHDLDTGRYSFVSYPSPWSPSPDGDDCWDYYWASTRFFICRRDELDYTEIVHCLSDSDYMYGKYGKKYRQCPWLEHVLGIIAGPGKVYYPPLNFNRYAVFSWKQYYAGTMQKLNEMPFREVVNYIALSGGIQYPCDVKGLQL